ncbi:LysR family transcriptional regulator [Nocardia sp. NBC_01499]|uniref:LysR family transcriptional regulator n=1 Tax=Nocardia sp. NBC_01499 TaxID=2903597 RepID=UPI00386D85DC
MELRDIEIFLALAEELHFGRTATRLHVTQARVSQAIKYQERLIGGALFDRSTRRNVCLTPLGEQLRDDLRPHYAGLYAGIDRARQTARTTAAVLRIGMLGWNTDDLRPVFDAFTTRRPGCRIQIRAVQFSDPFGPLRAGAIDAAILWLPVREPDLTVGPVVFTDPVVLAVSAEHALTQQESVGYEDLADHTVMAGATPDYWRRTLVPSHTPSGRLIPVGPTVRSFAEMIPILATGEAVSPVHAQAIRLAPRPEIAYLPIRDAPPAEFALVWRDAAETDLIRALAQTVTDLGPITL